MTMKKDTRERLNAWITRWPRSNDLWTIHVDELQEWQPNSESSDEWIDGLFKLYQQACAAVHLSEIVVVAITLEATEYVETLTQPRQLALDFFTPPSLYLLTNGLEFPPAAEQYYRILNQGELGNSLPRGVAIFRSARNVDALANGWEFDNSLYFVSQQPDMIGSE